MSDNDRSSLVQASLVYIERDENGNVTTLKTEKDLETDPAFRKMIRDDEELAKKFIPRAGITTMAGPGDNDEVWDDRCEFTPFQRGWNPSSCQSKTGNRCPGACNLRSKGMLTGTSYWCTCDGPGT